MVKRFALRETLNSTEACELIFTMIQSDFSEKDLLAYCVEGHIRPYVRINAKRVRTIEPEPYAWGWATDQFTVSGLQQVITPELIGLPGSQPMWFYGTASPALDPDESNAFSIKIEWSEECQIVMNDLWFDKRQLESFAEQISNAKERSLDARAEKGIGQTIAAIAALAAKGGLDLSGDAPFKQAQELDDKGEIEFTIGRDTFKKYVSMGRNYVIVGPSKHPKLKAPS